MSATMRLSSSVGSSSTSLSSRVCRSGLAPRLTGARVSRPLGLSVRANASSSKVAPPAGVTLPPQEPVMPTPMFGFVDWAEKINSRACMIGFFALIAVEAITGRGLLEQIGLRVGQGLGFEL